MGMAIVHVVGSLGVTCAFGLLLLFIAAWEQDRVHKRRLQDASIALGVPFSALESDKSLVPRLLQYSSQRLSGEMLRNRLSDLCSILRTAWGWLGTLVQVGIVVVVAVGWAMYSEGRENAIYMWSVLAVAVFFWLAGVAFSFVCLLLTGRYPGEAKAARKSLAAFIEQRNASGPAAADRPLANAWES